MNKPPRECASWCSNEQLAEAIWIGPEQPLLYAAFRDGKVDFVPALKNIVPPFDRSRLVSKGIVLLPGKPIPYGTHETLLSEMENFIFRYCDLRFVGEPGTGKSRCLQSIGHLCYKTIMGGGSTTASPLFRLLEIYGGTFTFDEADFKNSEAWCEIVKILNCGYMKGEPVLRSDKSGDSYEPRAFDVFGPKIIATRGRFGDYALESRCLTCEMSERNLRRDLPRQLPYAFYEEARNLRCKLLQWRFENYGRIQVDESAMLDLEPRMAQIATPLYNVTESKQFRQELIEFLQRTGAEDRSSRPQALVVEAIGRLVEKDGLTLHVKSVAQDARTLSAERGEEIVLNPKACGAIVRSLGFHTRRTRKGYVFDAERDRLAGLNDKYGVNL